MTLAGRTVGLAVQYLGTRFEVAAADGVVAVNPARGAKRPRVDSTPVVPYTGDEIVRARNAAPEWFTVAITLGAACELRQGEATGLTLDRINFLARTLTVDRQLVAPTAGEPTLVPLKTARSYRTVPLADVALDDIARHPARHGAGDGGLVLDQSGSPLRRQGLGQVWRVLRVRAGLAEGAIYHDCRHTDAPVCCPAACP